MMRTGSLAAVLAAITVGACSALPSSSLSSRSGDTFSAEIRRTAFGVPNITAADYGGLGYGFGYASAEDNICDIADRYVTVSGQRSRFFGPGENDANIKSDLYHRRLILLGEVERLLDGPPDDHDTPTADARELARGYVAGFNRYLRDTGLAALPDARCRGASYVRELQEIDFWRHMYAGQTIDAYIEPVASAAPPSDRRQYAVAADIAAEPASLGSNAYALGRDVTRGGRGLVLGNPHYFWEGPNRFYRAHFTIPGKVNVAGISYVGMPLIRIGHNEHIAWSNTVSTARRFGYFELSLDPDDPTRYLHDGVFRPMERVDVAIDVLRDGDVRAESHQLFATIHGPLVSSRTFPWTRERAFALRTVPNGLRDVDQYIAVWNARSVREMYATLNRWQAYRFNTTAADSTGETLFGDLGMIPNVDDQLAARCSISELARDQWFRNRIPVLDGATPSCDWRTDPDSSAPGVFGASRTPHLFRTDFVAQSNDSHWLTNPAEPLTGYSRIFGDERTPRSLRTRLSLSMLLAALEQKPPAIDRAAVKEIMFNNRYLAAELFVDDIVDICRSDGRAPISAACSTLASWDRRVDADSRGAHLFHLVADALFRTPSGYVFPFSEPFDPEQAVETPRVPDLEPAKVTASIESAVEALAARGLAVDARLGEVQTITRGDAVIPVHGGPGALGVFNVITAWSDGPDGILDGMAEGRGWTSVRHGASWIMVVEFTGNGPVGEGMLVYSQSTNPGSPHFADQAHLYANERWDQILFRSADVEAATLSRIEISQ
jgi:acyl-homoserine-lactone acylase